MNQAEFEQEARRLFDEWPESVTAYANALRDYILKDLAENNPPVAWYDPEHGLPYGWLEEPPTKNAVYLYTNPKPIPEGWQLVSKEPTVESIQAMQDYFTSVDDWTFSDMYRVGIAAAPAYKEDK